MLPRGARKITIKHDQLGVLRDYRYPIEIEAERTYEMVLVKNGSSPNISEGHGQILVFQVSPPTAVLEVNDQLWEIDTDGRAVKYVELGTYAYRVQAPNFHTEKGTVITNGTENSQTITVTLRPNYGWIEVTGENSCFGANVYINDSYAGRTPFKSKAISCGEYKVCVVKEMFDLYCETIAVREDKTTRITPVLSASMLSYSDASNDDNIVALSSNAKYGIVNGEFSVSPTNKVYFSKGNLQYQASTNSWRFAERQWNYIGETNQNISDSYDGWIDLRQIKFVF